MKKKTALILASIFAVSSLFIVSSALAGEIDTRTDLTATSQNSGQFERDLSYSNSDYRFN